MSETITQYGGLRIENDEEHEHIDYILKDEYGNQFPITDLNEMSNLQTLAEKVNE